MPARFNPDATCQAAINLAKSALPENAILGVEQLLPALYQSSEEIRRLLPEVAPFMPPLNPLRDGSAASAMTLADSLKPIVNELANSEPVITVEKFFAALMDSDAGLQVLKERGLTQDEWDRFRSVFKKTNKGQPENQSGTSQPGAAEPNGAWVRSAERSAAIAKLSEYGRLLTATELPDRGTADGRKPAELAAGLEPYAPP